MTAFERHPVECVRSAANIVEIFSEVRQVASNGGNLNSILDLIYEKFQGIIPFDRIGCALLDQSRTRVVARWCRSNRPVFLRGRFSAPLSGSSLQLVLERRCPRILNDLDDYLRHRPESCSTRLIVREGYRSSLTCPLIAEGMAVGFLFFSSVEPNTYSSEHVGMFAEIAGLVSQSVLISAERERDASLLDSCIDLLADIVGAAMPFAKVSACRAEQLIREMVERMHLPNPVEFIRTARLCRIGWISAPPDEVHFESHRASPGISEQPSLPSRAASTAKLVSRIPGLGQSAEIIALQDLSFAALRGRYGDIMENRVALGAALLKLVLDFDSLRLQGLTNSRALQVVRDNPEIYAPFLTDVLESVIGRQPSPEVIEIAVSELRVGMLLEESVVATNGNVLVASGRVINETLRKQIERFIRLGNSIREPLLISIPSPTEHD